MASCSLCVVRDKSILSGGHGGGWGCTGGHQNNGCVNLPPQILGNTKPGTQTSSSTRQFALCERKANPRGPRVSSELRGQSHHQTCRLDTLPLPLGLMLLAVIPRRGLRTSPEELANGFRADLLIVALWRSFCLNTASF